jgi:transcriptional regulator with PAS, ATPase and Fis domain
VRFYSPHRGDRPGALRIRPVFLDDPGFALFLNSLPDAVALVERDGRIRMVNLAFERLMATGRADLLGTELSRLARSCGEIMHAAAAALARLQRYQGEFIAPCGKPVNLGLTLLRSGEGPPYAGLLVLREQAEAGRAGEFRIASGVVDLIFEGEYRVVREQAGRALAAGLATLILGDTGTGKTALVSHLLGNDPRAPLVHVPCRQLSERSFERDMFGGLPAPGSEAWSRGYLAQAEGGTLFLDGVDDLSPALQARVLAMLEAPGAHRGPGRPARPVSFALVASAGRPLDASCPERPFRADLRYRLSGVALRLPALRDEPAMLEALVQRLLSQLNARRGSPLALSTGFMARLRAHDYPGNIRELENIIGQAGVMAGAVATADHFAAHEPAADPVRYLHGPGAEHAGCALREQVQSFEEWVIASALALHRSKRSAARALGIDVATLIRKTSRNQYRPTKETDT